MFPRRGGGLQKDGRDVQSNFGGGDEEEPASWHSTDLQSIQERVVSEELLQVQALDKGTGGG